MGSISLVWLTSLCLLIGCCAFMWCYAWISGCWDWREKAEKGSWYSIQAYSSKVWIFWTNCRSDKTDKQIHLLSYSLSWASPSFSRHDVLLKERAPCLFFIRVRATVDCCSSAWVIQKWHLLICSPCLGFEYWALSFRQPSVARTEPNLLSSAIACRSAHLHWGSFGLVFAGRRTQEYHQHVLATLGDEADFGDLALTKTDASSSPWNFYECRRLCRNLEAQVHWFLIWVTL